MSIWYDSNGKAYASDGNNGWTQKYIDKQIGSTNDELQTHFSGAGHRHGAEDVDYGSGETVKDVLDSKAPTDHSSASAEYGSATTALYGHVKLSDSVTSTSSANAGTAATPSAVKSAYDKAQSAEDQAQSTQTALTSKADKVTNGGFVAGNNASNASGGVAIGNYAKTTGAGAAIGSEAETASGFSGGYHAKSNGMGAAVGNSASAYHGGAAGYAANTSTGGAIGSEAKSTNGGAMGWEAVTGDGVAIGKTAKTVDTSNNAIDAVQLGTGTNNTAKTMQVYDKRIVEADGSLTDVGDLDELNTTDKTDIVNAINSITFGESVDAKKEVDIDDNFQPVNYNAYTNSGRYRFNHYSENTEGEAVDFEGTEILIVQNYVMKTDGYLYYVIQCSFYNGSIKFRYGFDDYEGVKWNDWITVAPNDVGDLSTLTTTDKSSAVGAINEVNNKKILAGDGQSDTLYKNCLGISVRDHGTVSSLNHDSLVTIGQHIIDFEVPACAGAPSNLSAGSYSGVIETVSQYKDASGDDADVYFNQCKQTLTLIKGLTSSTNGTWERYYYQTNDEDMTYTDWVSLEDELKSVSSNVQRPVTVFVAASDASAKSKSGADYICTGTNDEETIQDAVDSLPSVGGIVQLSEGTFVFSNNISNATAPQGVELKSNVTFKGSGASTIIDTYSASSTNSNSHIIDVSSCSGITVSDMHIKSGDQKYLTSINIDEAENIRVDNICFSLQGSDSGSLSIGSSSNIKVTNSQFEITESQISISINNNSQNITLKNNVFNVYDWEAINVYGASDVIIDGNFFKETYSNTGNSAINVNNALSNVMITNNVIDFPLEPVKVNSAASGKVFVYNNMVKTPPTASAVVRINMDGSSNNWNQTF